MSALATVAGRTLVTSRRAALGWLLGFAAMALLTVAFWPSIAASSQDFEAILEAVPQELLALFGQGTDLVSPTGYLSGRLFGLLAPLLLLVFAIGFGARAVAGEEEQGTLELSLAHPVSRRRFYGDKLAALTALLVLLVVGQYAVLAASLPVVGLEVPAGGVIAASVALLLLGLLFGVLALAVGAATGSRALAVGITSAVAAGTYLLRGFGSLVDGLETAARWTPFHAYDGYRPLERGLDGGYAGGLLAATVLLALAGLVAFERRDLR